MVQLKSFKPIEGGGGVDSVDEAEQATYSETSTGRASQAQVERQQQTSGEKLNERVGERKTSATLARIARVDSNVEFVGGGNLTSSDSSSLSVSASVDSPQASERANKQRARRSIAVGKSISEQRPTASTAAAAVATSEEENSSELTTLSSNEEYQLARVVLGDEENREEEEEVEQDEKYPIELETRLETTGVTKIDIDHSPPPVTLLSSAQTLINKPPGAIASKQIIKQAAATTTTIKSNMMPNKQQQFVKLNQINDSPMARAHTSPSQLNQLSSSNKTPAAAAAAADGPAPSPLLPPNVTGRFVATANSPQLERGKFANFHSNQTKSPAPPSSPALRSTAGQLNAADSASQHSLALQARYQGSKHFEIRWHNVRLYARPKSRVPAFISENLIYKSLFGGAEANALDAGGESPSLLKPPFSPPLGHHKIPPTIDENHEMKCPKSPKTAANARRFQSSDSSRDFVLTSSSSSSSNAFGGGGELKELQPQFEMATSGGNGGGGSGGNGGSSMASPNARGRCILNSISGQVFSGQMTAILGPSGVGKTSLLNSLTGRNTMDGTGRVSLIGANESKRMSVVTVPQIDVLPGKLSCFEDLQFTSRLKNPQTNFNHSFNIERLVKHLQMEKFLHTRIDKLSGGEARRLSIARELLSSPDIMILDEPTSGLDANTCKKIITALRDIVEHSDNILDKPMSIIITIHQPQQEVYELFHRIYVMAQGGGRAIYEGSPQMLLPTLLEQSSITRVCPQDQLNENPAIVAIEVASGEYGPQIIDELAIYHECQVYEEFAINAPNLTYGESPMMTPRSFHGGMGGMGGGRSIVNAHKSPMSVSRFEMPFHRKRLNSLDSSLGRPTPQLTRKPTNNTNNTTGTGTNIYSQAPPKSPTMERMSSMTSLSYASTYDEYLPEVTSKLKVDKRLRRSVVIKSHFVSHTFTLIRRCWLLTRRDLFLMAIRILGFLLVAGGTVQIFSHALDPNEHQCPAFETEIDDMPAYVASLRERLINLLPILRQANSVHLFFFHVLLCITMVTSALTGLVFPLQMRMFIREYKNGWYSPASFITSQTIAELPADIVGPLITLLITYPLCHQPDSVYHWRQIGYALVIIVTSIICKSQAQIVGAFLMDSVENSVFIACVCVTGPALLSGIPLRVKEMSTPLQWVSMGSFLRYSFESLMELRYGYGMCPCDPELVHGPLQATARAIPAHLENLAVGLLDLSRPNGLTLSNSTTTTSVASIGTNAQQVATMITASSPTIDGEHENLFLKFLRLITDAGNLFTGGAEIEDCSSYRSLYLIGIGIAPGSLVFWSCTMLAVFVFSRFLTYFAVKTVIKLKRR